jgi:hypothetical protein
LNQSITPKDLGNYAKVGNYDRNICTNAKLVCGESQDIQRAIFLQTTRPISEGEKIILSYPIESKSISYLAILEDPFDNYFT